MRHQLESPPQETNSIKLPDVLTAQDLEAFLKIDVKTIYRYVQRGLIPYVRIQSNLRFLKSQILVWIENQNYDPGSIRTKRSKNGR
jgi:predicted DNA-binding transcriptional regulator AlpA